MWVCVVQTCALPIALVGKPYDTCREWNDRVMDELTSAQPLLVVTSGGSSGASRKGSANGSDALVAGYVADWQRLQQSGVGVIVLADNPHPGTQVYRCVGEHPRDFTACDFPVGEGRGTSSLREAAGQVGSAEFIDLTPWLCPARECPAVIGNVLVYRQGSHITASYVETLAPVLRAALLPAATSARTSDRKSVV